MKAVIVRYKVRPEFVAENTANIERVLADHRKLNNPAIRYSVHKEDEQTFVHIGMYVDQAAVDAATSIESFGDFQKALKGSKPEMPPKATWLTPIGAGFDVFGT